MTRGRSLPPEAKGPGEDRAAKTPDFPADAGGPLLLPRELVLASAGTGKTFRISSRIVGLLAAGTRADAIFASTFTRKAAGEILDRVIGRLARAVLDEDAGAELAEHALLGARTDAPAPGGWGGLLDELALHLHRLQVGTLDSFFVAAASAFSLDLGFPPRWAIGDEPTLRRLESEALEEVLARAGREEVLELIRAVLSGEGDRAVHERILERVRQLRGLLHEVEPGSPDPWAPFGTPLPDPPDVDERREAGDRIEGLEVPRNADGSPDRRWKKALDEAARQVREGAWEELLGKGIGAKVAGGDTEYYGKPISGGAEAAFRDALDLAGRALRAEYGRRAQALGTLAERFDGALEGRQRRAGTYGFSDVTRRVAGAEPLSGRDELWYRLDRRARHLLLDEFQDTSLLQWEALRPLAEELLSGHRDERAAVIVADPKQSIYGWRGAEPELVDRLERRFHLEEDRLRRSYRSSPVVLEFVNQVFRDLDRKTIWEDSGSDGDRARVRAWLRDFDRHEAAHDLPGRVRVRVGPREASMSSDDRPRMMARAAALVAELREGSPERSVGVLLRKNRNLPLLVAELRRRGVEVSEEGGTALTDSAAAATLLALLRLADHPAHTVARYQVARSPLGPRMGMSAHDDDGRAREVAGRVRTRLLEDGYGPTLDRWTRDLGQAGALGARDVRRLEQLVELGFRWDAAGATVRPGDFVRYAEAARVEDPTAAGVRAMTVHQAKGLEFDAVVLPELDLGLTGGGRIAPAALPERDPETGRVRRVFPYLKKDVRPLLPEGDDAVAQARSAALRDALGVLYVGLTRARHALHLLVAADGTKGPSDSATYARLIREAIGAHDEPVKEGDVLFDRGDPQWSETPEEEGAGEEAGERRREPERLEVRLARPGARTRGLAHRAATDLDEEGGEVDLARLLSLDDEEERRRRLRRGTVVHEWCRRIAWIDEAPPPELPALVEAALAVTPGLAPGEAEALAERFLGWLEAASVREGFSRSAALRWARERLPSPVEEADLELHREVPFAVRLDEEILRGAIDRLVLVRPGAGAVRGAEEAAPETRPPPPVRAARILDFKTEAVPPGDRERQAEAARPYRPQLRAYQRAVARSHGVAADEIEAALLFLPTGAVHVL